MLYAMCVYVEQAVPGKGITQFTIVDVLRVVHTHYTTHVYSTPTLLYCHH